MLKASGVKDLMDYWCIVFAIVMALCIIARDAIVVGLLLECLVIK